MQIFAVLGILGMIMNIDHAFGVYFLSADISRVFEPTAPVWTVLFTVPLKLENIPSLKASDGILKTSGIILGILGTIITVLGKSKFKYKLSERPQICSLKEKTGGNHVLFLLQHGYFYSAPLVRLYFHLVTSLVQQHF